MQIVGFAVNHANSEPLGDIESQVGPRRPEALQSRRPGVFARYAVAIAASFAAAAATHFAMPALENAIFVFFSGSVVFSAWYGGRWAGILTAIVGVLLADYLFIGPSGTLLLDSASDVVPILVFVVIALLVSSLTDRLRSEKARAVASALEARQHEREARSISSRLEQQTEEVHAVAEQLEKTNEELLETNRELEVAKTEAIRTNEVLTHTLESISDSFTVYDSDWRMAYMNAAARHTITAMGKDPQHMVGRVIWDEFPEIVGTLFETEARRAVSESKPVDFEEFYPATGQWFRERMYPSSNGLSVYTVDITELKDAELQERAESNLIEAINRLGATLASELDPARIEQNATRAAADLTGAEFGAFSESYRNESPVRTDDVRDDPQFGDGSPFASTRASELDLLSYLAVPVISRSGEQLGGLILGHSQPAYFTDRHQRIANSIASWASVSMDNARLYAAERQARSEAELANKAKSAFLATMSHELRTPLNAIGGYADLLEVGVHGELTSLQQRDVSRIKRSQHNLLALINDILNFAKVEAGRVVYSTRPMILSEHLPELESLIAPLLREKCIEYEYQCGDPTCVAYADPEKVQQVLLNLLSNAVKFTDSGGNITLGCAADGRTIRIFVRDTGVGIAESKLETIFEPFIQLDRGTTSQHDGTGLGLAISRDLARGMGGDLTAESEPGTGSTFTLSLPMRPPA